MAEGGAGEGGGEGGEGGGGQFEMIHEVDTMGATDWEVVTTNHSPPPTATTPTAAAAAATHHAYRCHRCRCLLDCHAPTNTFSTG